MRSTGSGPIVVDHELSADAGAFTPAEHPRRGGKKLF